MTAFIALLKIGGGWLWGLLKSIPWPVWGFLAAVLAFYAYGEHQYRKGKAEVRKEWDEAIEAGRREIAELDRQNQAKEEAARLEAETIGAKRERDHAEDLAAKDRLISGLRAGSVQLHNRWQACLSGAQGDHAAGTSGGPDGADELRREIASQIFEADDADSRVSRLQDFVRLQQKTCTATN